MKVILPAVFTRPVFRSDGSVRLEFETREFSGEDAATLMDQRQKEGWILFSPNKEIEEIVDIPDERADSMTGQKSQAQRQRAVIYRLWQQSGKSGDFELYYRSCMERIIEQLKEKLDANEDNRPDAANGRPSPRSQRLRATRTDSDMPGLRKPHTGNASR